MRTIEASKDRHGTRGKQAQDTDRGERAGGPLAALAYRASQRMSASLCLFCQPATTAEGVLRQGMMGRHAGVAVPCITETGFSRKGGGAPRTGSRPLAWVRVNLNGACTSPEATLGRPCQSRREPKDPAPPPGSSATGTRVTHHVSRARVLDGLGNEHSVDKRRRVLLRHGVLDGRAAGCAGRRDDVDLHDAGGQDLHVFRRLRHVQRDAVGLVDLGGGGWAGAQAEAAQVARSARSAGARRACATRPTVNDGVTPLTSISHLRLLTMSTLLMASSNTTCTFVQLSVQCATEPCRERRWCCDRGMRACAVLAYQ